MMLRVLAVLTLAAALSPHLSALNIKVLSVDYKAGRVTLLLPMHNATVEAVLPAEEPEIRVRRNQFYEAEIEPGKVNTVKRNFVRIKIPREGVREISRAEDNVSGMSVRYRLHSLTYGPHRSDAMNCGPAPLRLNARCSNGSARRDSSGPRLVAFRNRIGGIMDWVARTRVCEVGAAS